MNEENIPGGVKNRLAERHGRLTVVAYAGKNAKGGALWLCSCDCGGTTVTVGYKLASGHTASCGCLQRENTSRANTHEDWAVGYDKSHKRLKRSRGPASQFECSCGCGRQALDWALRPGAEALLEVRWNTALRFSRNFDDYIPMARHCHRQMDIAERARLQLQNRDI